MERPRVALVTGAARRIGRAIALELARRGYDVGVHYGRSEGEAEETAAAVRAAGRRAAVLQAELSDAEAASALPARCAADLGGLDALVNNASVFERTPKDRFDAAVWQRILAVNLVAPAALCHAAAPLMRDGGAIVNLCDIAAERPWGGYAAYCASKAGLVALTKGLARALGPRVRVNAVSPGAAVWPEDYTEEQKQALIARIPASRAGTAEEIAAAVAFLVADATYVTGEVWSVDGGRSIAW